jgi:hypothetical protein
MLMDLQRFDDGRAAYSKALQVRQVYPYITEQVGKTANHLTLKGWASAEASAK